MSNVNYYYAYHGPKNQENFDYKGGYGVSQESKIKKIKSGDLVFVIQKLKKEPFKLCGVYKISGFYHSEEMKRKHRMHLEDLTNLKDPIFIDHLKIEKSLPNIKGSDKWSLFQRHFCRQGVSFQAPLENPIIEILTSILPKDLEKPREIVEFDSLVESFNEQIRSSSLLTSEERILRINKAKKKPMSRKVITKIITRNPDIVAETLFRSNGICGYCKSPAPFLRKSDGQPYLEVHHLIRLADGGEDTLENTIALCPNCHRKMHYG